MKFLGIMLGALLLAGQANAAQYQLTLTNQSEDPITFVVFQNQMSLDTVAVPSKQSDSVTTTDEHTVTATALVRGREIQSNPVTFDSSSEIVLAKVSQQNGSDSLTLTAAPGSSADTITLDDDSSDNVTFQVVEAGMCQPMSLTVNDDGTLKIPDSTWTIVATAYGVSTQITTFNPDATITAVPDASGGFQLVAR